MTIVGGFHTTGEVVDFVNYTSWRAKAIAKALDKSPLTDAKTAELRADWNRWTEQWDVLRRRAYLTATAGGFAAGLSLPLGVLYGSQMPAEDLWKDVTSFVSPVPYGPKDLAGLQQRVQDIAPINFNEVPAPKSDTPDVDMSTLRALEQPKTVIRNLGKAGQGVVDDAADAGLGVLSANKGKLFLAGASAATVLYLARRFKLI